MDHALEGTPGQLHKFRHRLTAVNIHHRRVGIQNPLVLHGPVDEKTVGHIGQGFRHTGLPPFLLLLHDRVDASDGDDRRFRPAVVPLADGYAGQAPLHVAVLRPSAVTMLHRVTDRQRLPQVVQGQELPHALLVPVHDLAAAKMPFHDSLVISPVQDTVLVRIDHPAGAVLKVEEIDLPIGQHHTG